MITAKEKFFTLLSSIQFVSDDLMLDIIDGKYSTGEPTSKEENKEVIKEWLKQIEERTRAQENKDFWENGMPLIPLDDLNLIPQNFDVFNLYVDVLKEVGEELNSHHTLREKKAYLNDLLIDASKYQINFLTNDYAKVEHIHGNKKAKLSKKFQHQNTWALVEVYKRYYEGYYQHLKWLHTLIHTSLESLSQVDLTVDARLLWTYKHPTEDINMEGTEGRTFEMLHTVLVDKNLIEPTTSLKAFKRIFSLKAGRYEKVIWLGTAHQLHYFIDELRLRKMIQPIGDVWLATTKVFKQPNGMDFNYKSLKGTTGAPKEARKEVNIILEQAGISRPARS